MPASTESADANGDTRTLHLYHTHSRETIDATYRVDGHYDPAVLRQLNHFLRDWRNDDEHEMDPRLFDAVWEAYRTAGASDRIHIYSAYRSPETNAMLRRRSRAVAERSQHMLGKAMDTTMPGFPMSRIREAGMKLQHGGVGWYPSSNFVHLDVGGVRAWPRMSYAQLASIFPDGKTVHISSDGRPMPGYEEARVQLAERGGAELPPAQESSGFLAWLFGNGNGGGTAREDEEERRAPVAVASAAPPPRVQQQAVAQQPAAAPQEAPQMALGYAGNAPVEPAAIARAQPASVEAQPEAQQVAAVEAPKATALHAEPTPEVVMPLPPRRPADLAVASLEDVPLPPARPDSLDHIQTASIRFTAAKADAVRANAASDLSAATSQTGLPAIITHGGIVAATRKPLPPPRLLAFAGDTTPLPVSRPSDLSRPMALRGAQRRSLVAAVPASLMRQAESKAGNVGSPICPKVMGLRRAAKLMGDASL